jgi:hypothetical protein
MSNKDGGPAFPVLDSNLEDGRQGMSLRDYFMAHAPINLFDAVLVCVFAEPMDWNDANRATVIAILAMMRGEYADAMIAERAK